MCISCKTTPLKFNQQIYFFGQKSMTVFTKWLQTAACIDIFARVQVRSVSSNEFLYDR